MIAVADSAPLRRIRLHRRSCANAYRSKERFAALCEEYSVTLVAISQTVTPSWTPEKDSRRCFLIDKSLHGKCTAVEEQELTRLQQEAEAYFDEVAPPPIDGALRIHAQLLQRERTTNE